MGHNVYETVLVKLTHVTYVYFCAKMSSIKKTEFKKNVVTFDI